MSFENATPRPWTKYHVFGSSNVELHGKQGPITVCPAIAHSKDDGDLIFTAVNAHAQLVEALDAVIRFLPIGFASTGRPDAARGQNAALQEAREKAEAALKLARSDT